MKERLFATFLIAILAILALSGIWLSSAQAQSTGQNVEFVGHIGGMTYATFVQGNYAYIGEGLQLTILDISAPALPTVVGKTGPFSSIFDIYVAGDYAYVAAGSGGLRVVDVSNPGSPSEVSFYDTSGSSRGVHVSGSYAYVADDSDGLRVVDVSNPATPTEVGFYDMGVAYGVYVTGGYAYVADSFTLSGLRVVDVSNPASPTEVGLYNTPGGALGVYVSGGHAYVAAGSGGLRVVDVSNPASPTEVGFYDTSGSAWDVYLSGGYAYVADYDYGLRVVDVSNPASPTEVGFYDTPGNAYSVYVSGSYAYVADYDYRLRVVDVSNPASPSEVGFFETPRFVRGVYVSGSYAYVHDGKDPSGGLWVVDVSNPGSPSEVGFYETPGNAGDVYVSGSYAYVADHNGGLRVVDVSNPGSPSEVGFYDTPGNAQNVYVSGSYAYVADSFSGGLRVVDVSNPASPTEVGFYDTPGNAQDVYVSGSYAYVADGNDGLRVVDVSNPASPTEVGFYDPPGAVLGVYVSGSYAYVATYVTSYGLSVVDVSNPASPSEVGFYSTPGVALGVYVSGSYAYVVDDHAVGPNNYGLRVVDVSNPVSPSEVGFYDTPGNAQDVHVFGNYAYVADDSGGLVILRFTGGGTTYSISGQVTDGNGISIPDVTISAGSGINATTNASGVYTLTGLITGTYTITPSKNGYVFDPPSSLPTSVPPNATGVDFTAIEETTYSISGQVKDVDNNPLSDVIILTSSGISATTDVNGNYTFPGLVSGTYMLTPTRNFGYYTFTPPMHTVPVPPNATRNFTDVTDSDGDGLYDYWETNGRNGLDLPAMGVDPNHKDIFVEIDYMEKCIAGVGTVCVKHNHHPNPDAIALVVEAFKNAPVDNPDNVRGINLHVDFGDDTPMKPGANWGDDLSRSNALPHDDHLSWTEFYALKKTNFDHERENIFHYAIFAHFLDEPPCTMSGQAPRPGVDLIVSLAGWGGEEDCNNLGPFTYAVGNPFQQAGTFMHELGHNLGLDHGGGDEINFKPNYLSVMNYAFQMRGLIYGGNEKSGHFDYSRDGSNKIPNLVEVSLNETVGLNGGSSTAQYGTRWTCPTGSVTSALSANNPIDWNCNGNSNETISANINNTKAYTSPPSETLSSYFDWKDLVYDGGGVIGNAANTLQATNSTLPTELTLEQDNLIPDPYEIALTGPGGVIGPRGYSTVYTFTIGNVGDNDDNYFLSATSSLGWINLTSVPNNIWLASGTTHEFVVSASIPPAAKATDVDVLRITATSAGNPALWTSHYVRTAVNSSTIFLPIILK